MNIKVVANNTKEKVQWVFKNSEEAERFVSVSFTKGFFKKVIGKTNQFFPVSHVIKVETFETTEPVDA